MEVLKVSLVKFLSIWMWPSGVKKVKWWQRDEEVEEAVQSEFPSGGRGMQDDWCQT